MDIAAAFRSIAGELELTRSIAREWAFNQVVMQADHLARTRVQRELEIYVPCGWAFVSNDRKEFAKWSKHLKLLVEERLNRRAVVFTSDFEEDKKRPGRLNSHARIIIVRKVPKVGASRVNRPRR